MHRGKNCTPNSILKHIEEREFYFNVNKFDKNSHIYLKKAYENHDRWEKIRGPVL